MNQDDEIRAAHDAIVRAQEARLYAQLAFARSYGQWVRAESVLLIGGVTVRVVLTDAPELVKRVCGGVLR